MKITSIAASQCVGCFACQSICPVNAIHPDMGRYMPVVDEVKCIDCGKCLKVCPATNEDCSADAAKTECAVGINCDDGIRLASSSGGVFSSLAEYFLERSFEVYGASLEEHRHVKHISVTRVEDLYKLRGSKYVQSDTVGVFAEIKGKLECNQPILFSGTPCQVMGLKCFLGQEDRYEQLIYYVDIVCHGVAQPWIWNRFLMEASREEGDISQINFRDKACGWRESGLSYYVNGRKKVFPRNECPYIQAYSRNLILRESCFNCNYKGVARQSDITLGDAWGLPKHSQYDDNRGTSLLLIHSDRMKKVIAELEKYGKLTIERKVCMEELVASNPCVVRSVSRNVKQRAFDNALLKEEPFSDVVKKLTYVPLIERVKDSIKFRINKLIRSGVK